VRLFIASARDSSPSTKSLVDAPEKMLILNGLPASCSLRARSAIAGGTNLVTINNDPTAHAEVVAIRNAAAYLNDFNLSGCEIYTSCEPCPMCLSAIYWARIDKIWFANTKTDAKNIGFDDSFIYDEVSKPLEERKIPIKQFLRNEGLEAFKLWTEKTDKTEY
jgi:tRNA(Arg) A34 adenosine deaminase TadA